MFNQKIQDWFNKKKWEPHPYQIELFKKIDEINNVLVLAPTGSGKTLAGFLPSINEIIVNPKQGLNTLYISPLKALANDIERNLSKPIKEMGLNIRLETRTGDTKQSKKNNQKYNPPNFLMTTPESFILMLSWESASIFFQNLRYLIIDEIHTLVNDKRGDLLSLGISRLCHINKNIKKIGLSATVSEPNLILNWLNSGNQPNVKSSIIKQKWLLNPEIKLPKTKKQIPWSGHSGVFALDEILKIINENKTTIVFVNTRAQSEILFQEIWRINENNLPIALHHGSLSKEQRLKVEIEMSKGRLRAVISTSSLDLGIDWSNVDHIINIGAPKGVNRLIQRVGRSGHSHNKISKASLIPTNKFELLECHAALNLIKNYHLDTMKLSSGALEVLAQFLVGLSISEPLDPNIVFKVIKKAFPYRCITLEEFSEALEFVSTGGYSLKGYGKFHQIIKGIDGKYRPVNKMLKTIWRMNVGTIVEAINVRVKLKSGRYLGNIEEYFSQSLSRGDTFIFGGMLLEFYNLEKNTLVVIPKYSGEPKIPSFVGGRLPISETLADEVRKILETEGNWKNFDNEINYWLKRQINVSGIPKRESLFIEIFKRGNRYYSVAYCFEGRKAHQTLGMLITKRMERLSLSPIGFVANDYAIAIWSKKCPKNLEVIFNLDILGDDLEEWLEETSILKRSFRMIATIAGLINQNIIGDDINKKQMTINSDLIYDVLKRHQPDHFLLKATRQDAAKGLTDISRLSSMLKKFNNKIEVKYLDKASPLAIPILLEIGKETVHGEVEEELLVELEKELSEIRDEEDEYKKK